MTKLYLLSPEVSGQHGPETAVTNMTALQSGAATVPDISFLEYTFDDWLGDCIIEAYPCFIITENVFNDLTHEQVSGLQKGPVKITTSELFDELNPDGKSLPVFHRLLPQGQASVNEQHKLISWSGHDLCLTPDARLVITEKVLELFRKHGLENCDLVSLEQ